MTKPWRTAVSLALLSLSMVSYEIFLMHFFSIVQWQHFAAMVISIALLGYGAAGTLLSLLRRQVLEHQRFLLPFFMVMAGFLMAASLPLSRTDLFLFDSYTLFAERNQFWKLVANYLIFFLPFFFGALAVGTIYMKEVEQIGRFYFADLLGAGMGGFAAIVMMWTLPLQSLSAPICLLPILSGMLLLGSSSRRDRWSVLAYGLVGISIAVFLLDRPPMLKPSPYKSISYAMNLPEARVEWEEHSPHGLLQVISSPAQRFAPGLSLSYQEEVIPVPVIFVNGNWHSAIPVGQAPGVLDYTTMALPYEIRPVRTLLQLNAGAGLEVSQALSHGVGRVAALEPNSTVLELLKDRFSGRTDSLYHDPRIDWQANSPRSYLQQAEEKYELIQLPLLGAFGGSVGLNAMEEDWTLTREGFSELWDLLEENGMLAVSCWIDMPQKMSLRLSGLISDLLQRKGIDKPEDHLVLIRSWGTLTFLVSRPPLSPEERRRVSDFCSRLQFDPVPLETLASQLGAAGGSQSEEDGPFNLIQDPHFDTNLGLMFSSRRDSLVQSFPFNIKVPTDDRPYFFQFIKIGRWQEQKALWGESTTVFLELGYFLVLITFVQLLVLALVLILLPLVKLKWTGKDKTRVILYFASLGLGYMFVEIVLIKHFQIFLGHPIYSIAAVISAMLISSGLGSRYSERFGTDPNRLRRSILFIVAVVFAYTLFLGHFLRLGVGLPLLARGALTIALVAIPAFFMGMPFPMGLKLLNSENSEEVPWAWGINGSVSVISTSLAAIIAVEIGFLPVLAFAGLAYLLAFAAVRKSA